MYMYVSIYMYTYIHMCICMYNTTAKNPLFTRVLFVNLIKLHRHPSRIHLKIKW